MTIRPVSYWSTAAAIAVAWTPLSARATDPTIESLMDRFVAAQVRFNDDLDRVQTDDDATAAVPAIKALDAEMAGMAREAAGLRAVPAAQAYNPLDSRHPAMAAFHRRWVANFERLRAMGLAGIKLQRAIGDAADSTRDFRKAITRAGLAGGDRFGRSAPPLHLPAAESDEQRAKEHAAVMARRVRVQIYGLRDPAFDNAHDSRLDAVVHHLRLRLGSEVRAVMMDDPADPAVTDVILEPVTDLDAIAARIDFGALTVRAADRTIIVRTDLAKVAAIVGPTPPPPATAPAPRP